MTDKSLKIRFVEEIRPALAKKLGIKNTFATPTIVKVVINVGIPKSDNTTKLVELVKSELAAITGQSPKVNGAKQSIAGFKIREGDPVGVSVTLRGTKMFDFLDKLCRIVLPQVKDFKGVKRNAFDTAGNYTLGLTEQIIFPEIDYSKVEIVHGMEIVMVTTAGNRENSYALLEAIGMPFEKETKEN